MNLRFSRFHVSASSPQHACKDSWLILARPFPRLCVALLLTAGVAGFVDPAGAAPKVKATPTPTPTPTATPTPTPTATPSPAATATPDPAATPTYSGTQQGQYISTAREAFVALRATKSQPFLEAHAALDAAGSMSAKGLKTKQDIAARRDLVAKAIAANDLYLEFVKTQEDAYRAELVKTPLIQGDVDGLVKQFDEKANTATTIKLRETERDALKDGDDMLAELDKRFGAWTVTDAGKVTFKKSADVNAMNTLSKKYNTKVAELQKLREELTPPAVSPSPGPSASPGAVPAASPAVGASAAPAATAKP